MQHDLRVPLGGLARQRGWLVAGALLLVLALALLVPARHARAGTVSVPVSLQADLLAKIVGFERGFRERAGATATVLVVTAASGAEAERSATQVRSAVGAQPEIGGVPMRVEAITFTTAAALAERCRQGVAIVYFGPGLTEEQVRQTAQELAGVRVLSVAAAASDVPSGIIIGFDLVSGKPKILVNLAQAQRQGIVLASGLLNLAKVYE